MRVNIYEYQSELVGCSSCSEGGALGILSVALGRNEAHRLLEKLNYSVLAGALAMATTIAYLRHVASRLLVVHRLEAAVSPRVSRKIDGYSWTVILGFYRIDGL